MHESPFHKHEEKKKDDMNEATKARVVGERNPNTRERQICDVYHLGSGGRERVNATRVEAAVAGPQGSECPGTPVCGVLPFAYI